MSGSVGIPDLLATARLGRAHRGLKTALQDASTELISGEAADKIKATAGDPMRLFAIENGVSKIDSRLPLLEMAKSRSGVAQTALENVQQALDDYAPRILGHATAADTLSVRITARDAESILGQIMSSLNAQVSGRHVFGGDDADTAPMADVETVLEDVRKLFRNEPLDKNTPAETLKVYDDTDGTTPFEEVDMTLEQRLAHYFGVAFGETQPPEIVEGAVAYPADAGKVVSPAARRFSDSLPGAEPGDGAIYRGGDGDSPPVELGDTASLDYAVRGDDEALRRMIMTLSVIALAPDHSADDAEMLDLTTKAAGGLIAAENAVSELRGGLGRDEARIENALARNQAERAALMTARNDLLGVDSYEAATRISQIELQIQSVYTLTARSSQLSLVNFLR